MPQMPFSPEEQKQIEEAVAKAESKTSGEIVTYYVEKSDDYQETAMRSGLAFTLLGAFALLIYHRMGDDWSIFNTFESILFLLGAMFLGIGISFVPFVKKAFAGKELMNRRVQARARQAFLEEEVFDTDDRTGIMIFMSMFEKRVSVIGDTGINAKVEQSEWNSIVDVIIKGMKEKKATAGIVEAIQKCGELLHQQGVEIRDDDQNELKDGIRIGT